MGFVVLSGGVVLTCVQGEPPKAATVLIQDDRIHGIYPTASEAVVAAAGRPVKIIDVAGTTLVPGMVDCHVHLFLSGAYDSTTNHDFGFVAATERAGEHLRAGVTTVRDVGAPVPQIFQLRDAIAGGAVAGPRIVAAGPILTTVGGHGNFIGVEVVGGDGLTRAIRDIASRGADCVKIAVSGGVATATSDLFAIQFSEVELRSAVELAHQLGLHVAAHASNAEAVRVGARAGCDSIEHGVLVDDEALDALLASNAVVVPTLTGTDQPPGFLEDERIPEFIRDKCKITLPAHRVSIRKAIAAGIPMVGGTDAGVNNIGHGLAAKEAAQLVECGSSTAKAVSAVTHEAARLLRLDDHIGTIEPGKLADIVAVGGNPLDDITHLADVRLVVANGVVVS